MDFKVFAVALIFTLTLVPFAVSAEFEQINNGSFESGDLTAWTKMCGNVATIEHVNQPNLYATDGSFYLLMSGVATTSTYRQSYCTTSNVFQADQNYKVRASVGVEADGGVEAFFISNESGCSYAGGDANTPTKYNVSNYYATDRNGFYNFPVLNFTEPGDAPLCLTVTDNTAGNNTNRDFFSVDDIEILALHNFDFDVTEPDQPLGLLSNFTLYTGVTDATTGVPLTPADANVQINFNGLGYVDMTYSAGQWHYDGSVSTPGSYAYTIRATGENYNTTTYSDSLTVQAILTDYLTVTPIENVSAVVHRGYVELNPGNDNEQIAFSVTNNGSFTLTPDYNIFNSLVDDGKQYFVYYSDSGILYTLDDTLTFGSGNSDAVQKIFDENAEQYTHSFNQLINPGSTKYYKLTYDKVALDWETIGGSTDWVNVNPPTLTYEGETKRHYIDLFQNSAVTHLNSYTRVGYPDLTSVDLTTGIYFQFTAKTDLPGAYLDVGYKIGDTNYTTRVNLTTTKTRYTVSIDSTDNDAQLYIGSDLNASFKVYLTDYAVIPKAYFVKNLKITNGDGSPLNTIVRTGNSYRYVREISPFSYSTVFYDRERDLDHILIEVQLDGNVVKTYEKNLDYSSEFYSTTTNTFSISGTLDGIIDYEGRSLYPNGTTVPLKDVVIKAILVNNDDENVSEQYDEVKFLQYPYFLNDIEYYISALNKKVGDNVKFSLNFIQKEPTALIGFEARVYDTDHNVLEPNYSTIIYKEDLGCQSLISCSKTITLDEFAYSSPGDWFITIAPILTTEQQSFNNSLTYKTEPVVVSYTTFETARVLQVFERTDDTYLNSEKIPLVLQVRNDKLENLKDKFVVYMNADVNDGSGYTTLDYNWTPDKFIYDELTGYNYWFWNTYFYDTSGNLIPDGNSLRLKALILPLTAKTEEGVYDAYGLVNKCQTYAGDFFRGTFLMNWFADATDAVGGCTVASPTSVTWDSGDAVQIHINNSDTVEGDQSHSVFCVRTDATQTFKQDVGDEFVCGVVYRKSEQMIDGFHIMIGNDNSDYSLTGNEKQYIDFDIDQTTVMFNDILMLRYALQSNFNTDKIDTVGELLSSGINQLLPYGQGLVDTTQLLAGNGVFIQNIGSDINLSGALDPTQVSGMFFFKVKGMSVINVYNYKDFFNDIDLVNPKYFRREANADGIPINPKQATVSIYSSSFEPIDVFKIPSPLVIKEIGQNKVTNDVNSIGERVPNLLKFNFIVDMFSNNEQAGARAYVPIVFTYVVPPDQVTLQSVIGGISEFGSDPMGWLEGNWFIAVLILILIVVISLVYANFKGKGNTYVSYNGGSKGA